MRLKLFAVLVIVGLSGAAQATLFDRGNGLIYDDVLDVTWLQDAGMGGSLNWADANTSAADLNFGGYDDWRLPSMDVNGDQSNAPGLFTNVQSEHWSGTEFAPNPNLAWFFGFGNGSPSNGERTSAASPRGLCADITEFELTRT